MFGSGTKGGLFGSSNNNNNWGSSSGFGSSFGADKSAPAPGINSSSALSPGIGAQNTLQNNTPFNNILNKQQFGNSQSSGLFGNAGNSTLFGNSSTNPGASSTSSNLFPSSTTRATLSGNPGAPNNNISGLSLPNSRLNVNTASSGIFNGTKESGLFGNAASSSKTAGTFAGGLFNKPAGSGGLNTIGQTSGGLFGSGNADSKTSTNSPYSFDTIFQGLNKVDSFMPRSVTDGLFESEENKNGSIAKKNTHDQFKRQSTSRPRTSSLLSKLGKSLKFLTYNGLSLAKEQSSSFVKGLFTQSNFVNSTLASANRKERQRPNKVLKPISNISYPGQGIRRLIIKSKPQKFHLIDADNVLDSRRTRILATNEDALKGYCNQSDDELESELVEGKGLEKMLNLSKKADLADRLLSEKREMNGPIKKDPAAGEYWSSPSIDDLRSQSSYDLCNVEDFIIGRRGFGQIAFGFPVDLSSTINEALAENKQIQDKLFGDIVEIDNKIVKVYHNNLKKPPVGQGINVPAIITLENVEKKDDMPLSEFIKYLKRQPGMEFVTYDPITCAWTFKVQHFSIWGLIDESVSQQGSNESKRKQATKNSPQNDYTKFRENHLFNQELKKQRVNAITKGIPGGWEYNPSNQDSPLNIKRKIVGNEINEEINKLKPANTSNIVDDMSDITISSEDEAKWKAEAADSMMEIKRQTNIFTSNQNYDYLKQLFGLPSNANMSEIIHEKAYEPEVNSSDFENIEPRVNLAVSNDWALQLELAGDLNSALSTHFAEPNKLLGGHPSIDKMDDVLFSDFNKDSVKQDHSSTPLKRLLPGQGFKSNLKEDPFLMDFSKVYYNLLQKSEIANRKNGFPSVKTKTTLLFEDFQLKENATSDEDYRIMLCSSLFDPIPNKVDKSLEATSGNSLLVSHLKDLERKRIFGEWLKRFNERSSSRATEVHRKDDLDRVFMKVCSYELKDAVLLALQSKNAHLATILPLLDSNDEMVRFSAKGQLDHWKNTAAEPYVPPSIIKIFKILSGDMNDVCKNLLWNISLAIKFFYGDNSRSFSELLARITNEIKGDCSEIEIIKMYSIYSKGIVDELKNAIRQSKLDTKMKWYISKALSLRIQCDDILNEYSMKLGRELEERKLVNEAVFVYAHTSDDNECEEVIRQLIIENITEFVVTSETNEEFLTNILGVPKSLIYEAISIREHVSGNYWDECIALINARLWDKAHECMMYYLGPLTVISSDEEQKDRFFSLIARFPQGGKIVPSWRRGAGVFQCYLNLTHSDSAAPHDIVAMLDQLLTDLPLLAQKANGSNCWYAIRLMCRKVGDMALDFELPSDVADKIMQLPLDHVQMKYFLIRLKLLR